MIMLLFLTLGFITLISILFKGESKSAMDAFCELECKREKVIKHRFCC